MEAEGGGRATVMLGDGQQRRQAEVGRAEPALHDVWQSTYREWLWVRLHALQAAEAGTGKLTLVPGPGLGI